MGTRTWSRRGVLTAAGKRRAERSIRESTELYDITKQLDDWSTYPSGARQMFDRGVQTVSAYLEDDLLFRDYMRDYLGLDPKNAEHVEVVAALMGITSGDRLHYDEDERTFYTTGVDSSGQVSLNPSSDGTIDVDISTFAKHTTSQQKRLAYSMIRRMVWGIRRYAEINGVPPSGRVYLQAESDDQAMNGMQTWGKLGFNFLLRGALMEAVRSFGFAGERSNDIMTQQNAAGTTGMDAWDDIVQRVIDDYGRVGRDGDFDVRDESPSMQTLNAYARTQRI